MKRYRWSSLSFVALLSIVLLVAIQAAGAQTQADRRCFPETGKCISGPIRVYWETNGGLPVFGYPLTDVRTEQLGEWSGPVQWFERDRLEDHGSEGVMAGRLGAYLLQLQGNSWTSFAQVSTAPMGCIYVEATRHSICEPFRSYWQQHGGLERFGYPISEPFVETVNGWTGTVQYFERRRMEQHPELPNSPVLLGLLGSEVLDLLTQPAATPTPAPDQCTQEVSPAFSAAYDEVTFRDELGCPAAAASSGVNAALQYMENGIMLWLDRGAQGTADYDGRIILAVVQPGPAFRIYEDTWDSDRDEYELDMSHPSGFYSPRGGFGKVWLADSSLRYEIGWALQEEEQEHRATVQDFRGGLLVGIGGKVYAFGDPNTPEQVQIVR